MADLKTALTAAAGWLAVAGFLYLTLGQLLAWRYQAIAQMLGGH